MAQETGSVTTLLEAFLRVSARGGNSIDCLIDTGFSGALVLPRSFVAALEAVDDGSTKVSPR